MLLARLACSYMPESPEGLLQSLASCMRGCRPLLIVLTGAADLDGFLGTLLVLMQTAQTSMRIRTADTAVDVLPSPATHTILTKLEAGER